MKKEFVPGWLVPAAFGAGIALMVLLSYMNGMHS